MWEKGAIIRSEGSEYKTIDDMFNHVPLMGEYISEHIIENPGNADFFERVYKVDLATRVVYELKEKAKELLAGNYKA